MSGHTMDPERWQRLSALFEQAVELEGEARAAFVRQHCAGDPELRAALEAMLAGDQSDALVDAPLHQFIDPALLDSPTDTTASGSLLGPWRLDRVLGSGGMGVVYLAHREGDFAQKVAIKRLRQRWEGRLQAERFVQERQILANLSHPYIARLLDGGLDAQGQPWFAMEYIDGAPITTWADTHQLGLRQRIGLLLQVCEAVQHAHERFVVHRDLKPDNILVDAEGHPKVLDFGVAKLVDPLADSATRTGVAVGFTPEYATPEQISGGAISAATDVYALGLVLYQLLTGRLPYDLAEHDLPARVEAISQRPPMRPEQAITSGPPEQVAARLRERHVDAAAFRRFVRGDLTRILQTALAKEPERRYATVQALADDLQRFLDGRPVSVVGDTVGYRARKFAGRNRWGVAMGALAGVALIAGGIGILVQSREARAQRDAALMEASRATAVREYVMLMFGDAARHNAGQSLTARDVLATGAEEVFKRFQDQPENGQAALLMLAELYVQIGDHAGAVPLLERMLAWEPESQDPSALADARNTLAGAEYQRGNLPRARELLAQAQDFWNRDPQAYQLRLLESRGLQSVLERAEGKPEQGVATVRAALEESVRLRGPTDSDTMKIYNNLANALLATGHPEQALQTADTAWALAAQAGRQRSDYGLALMNVRGVASASLNRMREARDIFAEAAEIQRDLYGPSLQLAVMLQNLGNLRMALDEDPPQTIAMLRESAAMAARFAGESSPATLSSRILLAEALANAGQVGEAKQILGPAEATVAAQLGEKHPLAARGWVARAHLQMAHGQRAEALQSLDRAQRILEQAGPAGTTALRRLAEFRARIHAG